MTHFQAMDHSYAQSIFRDIQSRPYRVSTQWGDAAANCYNKGTELLLRLGVLGYPVRGRVCETVFDAKLFPAAITALLPPDFTLTHFFVEAEVDGAWRALDPSFQPALARHGFPIGAWEGGGACFPITELYDQARSIAFRQEWLEEGRRRDFFVRGGPCFAALNQWLATLD